MQPQEFNPYAPPVAAVDQGLQLDLDGHVLADRGTRFAAWLIDWLLSVAVYLPSAALMFAVLDHGGTRWLFTRMNEDLFFGLFTVLGLMAAAFHIFQWYLIATTGQSLAKRWLGIMIVRTDGTACGFANGVVLRSWVMVLLNIIPVAGPIAYFLVDPLMILGDERRCLHDQIASTRVIVAPRA